jgi:hypothetical protein
VSLSPDARTAERYRRLVALASSPNEHEATIARKKAERLAAAYALGSTALRSYAPPGQRDLPWWGAALLHVIAEHLFAEGAIAAPTWEHRDGDAWISIAGSRSAIVRARVLYAGARAAIALAIKAGRHDEEAVDAIGLAAVGSFGRNLAELRSFRRPLAALTVWREPEAAPLAAPPPWQLQRLYVLHAAAASKGDRLGGILGSLLELDRRPVWS